MRGDRRPCTCRGRCVCDLSRPETPVNPPTPTPTEGTHNDGLTDDFALLNLDVEDVTARDVLADNEIAEDDPPPLPPPNILNEWFLVSIGRLVGCVLTWQGGGQHTGHSVLRQPPPQVHELRRDVGRLDK
ncbi:hypothetical protein EIP86_010297 [Pleurotus ostreatoroseus]|nr:hypothetical protein EIP86_010297 [Pleurotus ostreatoroseus]